MLPSHQIQDNISKTQKLPRQKQSSKKVYYVDGIDGPINVRLKYLFW
jgi:hypothetical protein